MKLSYAKYRLEKARECLRDAERNLLDNAFAASANRSYYCIFHAMRAVLALDSLDSKKHSDVISVFRQRYIKTGVFPKEFSKMIESAFDIRGGSDYEDFFAVSKEVIARQAEDAKAFLEAVEKYIEELKIVI